MENFKIGGKTRIYGGRTRICGVLTRIYGSKTVDPGKIMFKGLSQRKTIQHIIYINFLFFRQRFFFLKL
jgi:hypothetical protein